MEFHVLRESRDDLLHIFIGQCVRSYPPRLRIGEGMLSLIGSHKEPELRLVSSIITDDPKRDACWITNETRRVLEFHKDGFNGTLLLGPEVAALLLPKEHA